jgi:hypothetical protein
MSMLIIIIRIRNLNYIIIFKSNDNANIIIATAGVCTGTQVVLAGIRIAKEFLFAGLAFARVTILIIRKSNGVSCPGWSSESH